MLHLINYVRFLKKETSILIYQKLIMILDKIEFF